jgi:hypothetical protein
VSNAYVRAVAVPNIVLFAGRLILAHNAVLYPGYKWLFRVLREVPSQPGGLVPAMDAVIDRGDRESVDTLFDLVTGWRDWAVSDQHWGTRFMLDAELAWLDARPPIADL